MVIFFGEGRLGNQIFQYAFLRTIAKTNEWVISDNADQLSKLFNGLNRFISIENKYIRWLIRKLYLKSILTYLSKLRIISAYKPVFLPDGRGEASDKFIYTRGVFPIIYVYSGYFQSELCFDKKVFSDIKIRDEYAKEATAYLSKVQYSKKLFVHIRRGDYVNQFTIFGKNPTLPLSYYKNSINKILANNREIMIIFLTDDIDFVKDNFIEYGNSLISSNSLYVDFAIMTECDYGILSNSSFSWWVGYFMRSRDILISPEHWLGYHSNIEFPNLITPSFATLVTK
jgi:hypothetical protein